MVGKKRDENVKKVQIAKENASHLVFKQPVIIGTLSFRAMSTYFVVSNDMAHSMYMYQDSKLLAPTVCFAELV